MSGVSPDYVREIENTVVTLAIGGDAVFVVDLRGLYLLAKYGGERDLVRIYSNTGECIILNAEVKPPNRLPPPAPTLRDAGVLDDEPPF